MSVYTEMIVARMPGGIAHIAPPSFLLVCGRQKWLTEFHPWHGPSVVNKDGSVKDKQPCEKSMFWRVACWWRNQGERVVDGVGQWEYPPRAKIRYRQVGSTKFIVAPDDCGEDVVEFNGDWVDSWTGD